MHTHAQQQTNASTASAGPASARNPPDALQQVMNDEAAQPLSDAYAPGLEPRFDVGNTARFSHNFGLIRVHAAAPVSLQRKPALSAPGDLYEQEADRAAGIVMRMTEPPQQQSASCPCGGVCPECQAKQPEQSHRSFQARRSENGGVDEVPPIVHEVLSSHGQPLSPEMCAFMGPRFGHDFSRVRVHTDEKAAESARSVDALAYTIGRDIVFGAGQYAPRTSRGQWLLAHELTHVVQQSAGQPFTRREVGKNGPGEGQSPVRTSRLGVGTHAIQRNNGGQGTPPPPPAAAPPNVPELTRGPSQDMARQALGILRENTQLGQQERAELADALFQQVARRHVRQSPYDDRWTYRRINAANGIIFTGPSYSVAFDSQGRMWLGGGVSTERGEYTLEGTNIRVNYDSFGQSRQQTGPQSAGEALVAGRGRAPNTGRPGTILRPGTAARVPQPIEPDPLPQPPPTRPPGSTPPSAPPGSAPPRGAPPGGAPPAGGSAPPGTAARSGSAAVTPTVEATGTPPRLTVGQAAVRLGASIGGGILLGLVEGAIRTAVEARLMESDMRELEPEINRRLNSMGDRVAALRAQSPQQQLYANITIRIAERETPIPALGFSESVTDYDGLTLISVQVSTERVQEEARGEGHERHGLLIWYSYRFTVSIPIR